MQSLKTFTSSDVAHIALLSHIPVTKDEENALAEGFNTTMKMVNLLFSINVAHVEPTHQVTGLENVTREDIVDTDRMFTQEQALMNAPKQHNGYFMVDRVLTK
jgi:aspartyl-tRNA(Asn)/glutamyl-tRNA(Gln) amidotransferase subunit C